MKRIVLLPLLLICLITIRCGYDKTQTDNQENLIEWWYDNVFTNEEDTTSTIPDYVYYADWMQRYVQYIVSNFEMHNDKFYGEIDGNPFDCRCWSLAYIDSDTIPEMLLYGGCHISGAIILTQYNGEVYTSPIGCFSYIKGSSGLLHSHWLFGDSECGEVYEMRNGKFTKLAQYDCFTDYVDTNKVRNYGLALDSLKNNYAVGEIDDDMVGISMVELNGKRMGACFGYDRCAHCTGFDMVKQTLDSLYYSKGNSMFFPHLTREMDIKSLLR